MERASITIYVEPTEMHTASGIEGRLTYQVGSLDIYVTGKVSAARKPAVHNLAMNAAIAAGYRAAELRCVTCQQKEKRVKEIKNLRLMGF